jgi:hypothetical protein
VSNLLREAKTFWGMIDDRRLRFVELDPKIHKATLDSELMVIDIFNACLGKEQFLQAVRDSEFVSIHIQSRSGSCPSCIRCLTKSLED